LKRRSDDHGSKPNPTGEDRKGQKSMQIHASHLLPGATFRGQIRSRQASGLIAAK
jgi:hypothetical protein